MSLIWYSNVTGAYAVSFCFFLFARFQSIYIYIYIPVACSLILVCPVLVSLPALHSPVQCVIDIPILLPPPGFLPSIDPLQRLLQPEFQPWEAMADSLPSLLAVGQARKPLASLPDMPIGWSSCF